MPRVTRYERERIAKLFGNKTKPIFKPSYTQNKVQSVWTPPQEKAHQSELRTETGFKVSKYIQMSKVYTMPDRTQQIKKFNFRCYDDADIFGEQELVGYLKQNHDNDHDTPPEQVKYDVNRGIKKLKEEIERRNNGDFDAQSERALSVGGLTPASYAGIRICK